ncbi:MAG: tyrosine--tRNA ligase [bacterium]
MKIITDEHKIDDLLSRSVVEVLPLKDNLKASLMSGKQLRVYIGADPTGQALHLGHATNFIVLEKYRQLGHKAIILVGDFTARIGDPTDKTAARVQLTREQVIENAKSWLKQLAPIIDITNKENPVEIVYNHDWLAKMNFEDVIDLASNFTVQQMLERDMFEKRIAENKPIYVHEFFYPLMQGYDSVHLDVDIEICGNDQKFNALTGRTLLKRYKNKEKFVFITTLLENPITKEKMMSKSLGTGVFLNATPADMFGKIMMQPDENIVQLFTDCTHFELDEIAKIKNQLEVGEGNPRDIKVKLGHEIVRMYHGEKEANEAVEYFVNTFTKKEIPTEMPDFKPTDYNVVAVLIEAGLVPSKGEARRVLEQGGIKIDGEVVSDASYTVPVGVVLQKGKIHFLRIV